MHLRFENLRPIGVWCAPSGHDVTTMILQILREESDCRVYYIDATNSFPIKEFGQALPNHDKSFKRIMDSIHVATALDLAELEEIVIRLGRERGTILVYINGLEIMAKNTQFNQSAPKAHSQLKNILLSLRSMCISLQTPIRQRTVLAFPNTELPQGTSFNSMIRNKRLKSRTDGHTVAEYVLTYYADGTIS